jgi:hypothetical protein
MGYDFFNVPGSIGLIDSDYFECNNPAPTLIP